MMVVACHFDHNPSNLNLQADSHLWNGSNVLVILAGAASEEIRYWKSSSLHLWLLGYEFTDTVLVFTPTELHALSGSKKTDILKQLEGACKDNGITLHLHTKPKKESGSEQIEELMTVIKASEDHSKIVVGYLPKVGCTFSSLSIYTHF